MTGLVDWLSVIIPVAPYHVDKVLQAKYSTPNGSELIVIYDDDHKGPGWARNEGIKQAAREWVIFLDADDFLTPVIATWERVKQQIDTLTYQEFLVTRWLEGDKVRTPSYCAPFDQTYWKPLILRRETARSIRFDEQLKGMEDTDYWLQLFQAGYCPEISPEVTMRYTAGGRRSNGIRADGSHRKIKQILTERYSNTVACRKCGDKKTILKPVGEPSVSTVLVRPTWRGNRRVFGPATGKAYGRISSDHQVYMDKRDADVLIKNNSVEVIQRRTQYRVPRRVTSPTKSGLSAAIHRINTNLLGVPKQPPSTVPTSDYLPLDRRVRWKTRERNNTWT